MDFDKYVHRRKIREGEVVLSKRVLLSLDFFPLYWYNRVVIYYYF